MLGELPFALLAASIFQHLLNWYKELATNTVRLSIGKMVIPMVFSQYFTGNEFPICVFPLRSVVTELVEVKTLSFQTPTLFL
jgi:hypothetical protein